MSKCERAPNTPGAALRVLPGLAAILCLGTFAARPALADETLKPVTIPVYNKLAPEGLDDLLALEHTVEEVAKKVVPFTVAIRVGGAQGSGVIVSKDGYVMTAGHVSGAPNQIAHVTLSDGTRVTGKTLGRNIGVDSGLIKLDGDKTWPFAELGSSRGLKVGQWCVSTGHPLGYQRGRAPVVRLGRVVSSDSTVIHTDCTLISGDSGGPLFDLQGKVIGIHSRIARPLTMNFHVPVATYADTWGRLTSSQQWGAGDGPMIGIRGEDRSGGCLVKEVFSGLPADEAGLQVGDVISKFEGAEVQGLQDLIDEISRHKAGEEVTVEFVRDGRRVLKKLVLVGRGR